MVRYKNEMSNTSAHWLLDKVRMLIEACFRIVDGDRTFYNTNNVKWIQDFESNYLIIKGELVSLLSKDINIPDWQSISDDPSVRIGKAWKVFIFKAYKNKIERNCALCPLTSGIIDKYPHITTAWFSILEPGKEIPLHRGPYNGVLRYHLGLIIPIEYEKCGIMVKDDIRHWEEGKSLLFDDTHLHKAWNKTDSLRVVLFMDVIRPMPFPFNLLNRLIIHFIKSAEFPRKIIQKIR